MMMELLHWFQKGLTFDEYLHSMNVYKEETLYILNEFELTEEEQQQAEMLQQHKLKAIVLTMDWCGDAMLNIPILLNIAATAHIDVRFLLRDDHLELMDQYLTNGTSRSIPIFIFIDEQGNEWAVWGPRAASIQKLVSEEQAKLPNKDALNFKEKQQEMIKHLVSSYQKESHLWREISTSIIETVKKK